MANMFYHLFFSEKLYQQLEKIIPLDLTDFMCGNLIPDLAIDKKNSHYQMRASKLDFWVPNLKRASYDLLKPENPLYLGMYCHLYLDYHFIEEFLLPNFIWDYEKNEVIHPKTGSRWCTRVFFSDAGLYGAYTQISHKLLKDGYISLSTLGNIPEVLPRTGITIYDTRKEQTWKEEFQTYLKKIDPYIGGILDYPKLCRFVEEQASKLANELKKLILSNYTFLIKKCNMDQSYE